MSIVRSRFTTVVNRACNIGKVSIPELISIWTRNMEIPVGKIKNKHSLRAIALSGCLLFFRKRSYTNELNNSFLYQAFTEFIINQSFKQLMPYWALHEPIVMIMI